MDHLDTSQARQYPIPNKMRLYNYVMWTVALKSHAGHVEYCVTVTSLYVEAYVTLYFNASSINYMQHIIISIECIYQ